MQFKELGYVGLKPKKLWTDQQNGPKFCFLLNKFSN